ncbi:MAG: hypothetical protein QME60_00325 [Verrucomicrobiota bacterium]|nr:hypothetical protein [Verrucomicrobiota bacterium]
MTQTANRAEGGGSSEMPPSQDTAFAKASFHRFQSVLGRMNEKRCGALAVLAIGALILILQNNKHGFEKGHHGYISSHGCAIAANLSLKKHLFMYDFVTKNEAGTIECSGYNRFSHLSYLAARIGMALAGDNLALQIHLARQVMNLFFIGAMLCVFLSVWELSRNAFTALTVAGISFSPMLMVYYNDMIFNETPALCGLTLTLYGVVVHAVHGRARQLFVKSLLGVWLGFQAFAVLLVYIVAGVLKDAWETRSLTRWLKGPWLALGLATLLFAAFYVGLNLVNEHIATGKPFSEMSTIKAAKYRVGQDESFNQQTKAALDLFWGQQVERMEHMVKPQLFAKALDFRHLGVILLVAFVASLILFRQRRPVLLVLWLSGIVWAMPMKHFVTFHDFQTVFYVGIPIAFYYVAFSLASRAGNLAGFLSAAFALAVFVGSFVQVNNFKGSFCMLVNPVTQDCQVIRGIVGRGKILATDGPREDVCIGGLAPAYYFSGNYFGSVTNADYVLSRNPRYNPALLTPGNRHTFLFLNVDGLASPPHLKATSVCKVYQKDAYVLYEKAPCTEQDLRNRFYLMTLPEEPGIFRPGAGALKPATMEFDWKQRGFPHRGGMAAVVRLPDGPVSYVRTGQTSPDDQKLWEVQFQIGR